MDRSFLSDAQVISASRDFVCIRLATYEDAAEAEFLKQIFTGRSGELENTVFCLLSPNGQEKLSLAGRGPQMAFRNPRKMAAEMKLIAARYETSDSGAAPVLPQMKNFRLGLNVAECDALPLVLCVAQNQEQMQEMHDALSPLARSENLAGRFVYASSMDSRELTALAGQKPRDGFVVIASGQFGIDGEVRQVIAADATTAEISQSLTSFVNHFRRPDKDHDRHVRAGKQLGVDWETEIPVTDPMSNRARQQAGPGGRGRPPQDKR